MTYDKDGFPDPNGTYDKDGFPISSQPKPIEQVKPIPQVPKEKDLSLSEAFFPRTKKVGVEPVDFSQTVNPRFPSLSPTQIAVGADLSSIPGRLVGSAINQNGDIASSVQNGFKINQPFINELGTIEGSSQSTLGSIGQTLIRDPLLPLNAVAGAGLGNVIRNPLVNTATTRAGEIAYDAVSQIPRLVKGMSVGSGQVGLSDLIGDRKYSTGDYIVGGVGGGLISPAISSARTAITCLKKNIPKIELDPDKYLRTLFGTDNFFDVIGEKLVLPSIKAVKESPNLPSSVYNKLSSLGSSVLDKFTPTIQTRIPTDIVTVKKELEKKK